MSKRIFSALAMAALLTVSNARAQASMQSSVDELTHRWAAISYQTPENRQAAEFEQLADSAAEVAQSYPGRAEPLVWQAIILASTAKAEGGLGALSKVKKARQLLLDAEKIDPAALNGSIYSSLGSLYAKVPGWPIGFGDKKKAAEYFQKALSINAGGIDAHYFYADLLADQGDYAGAELHLKQALAAPPRPGRADADAGRRQEVLRLLETLKQKHGDKMAGI